MVLCCFCFSLRIRSSSSHRHTLMACVFPFGVRRIRSFVYLLHPSIRPTVRPCAVEWWMCVICSQPSAHTMHSASIFCVVDVFDASLISFHSTMRRARPLQSSRYDSLAFARWHSMCMCVCVRVQVHSVHTAEPIRDITSLMACIVQCQALGVHVMQFHFCT